MNIDPRIPTMPGRNTSKRFGGERLRCAEKPRFAGFCYRFFFPAKRLLAAHAAITRVFIAHDFSNSYVRSALHEEFPLTFENTRSRNPE